MFVQNFINYLEKIRRYSPRTVNSYRQNLGYLCDYLASVDLSIDNVSTKQLSGYIMYCMEKGLQPKSINQHLASIRSYFDYCCRFEGVKNNPAAGLRDVRTPKKLPRFISEEKMSFLIDHFCHATRSNRLGHVLWSCCFIIRAYVAMSLRLSLIAM